MGDARLGCHVVFSGCRLAGSDSARFRKAQWNGTTASRVSVAQKLITCARAVNRLDANSIGFFSPPSRDGFDRSDRRRRRASPAARRIGSVRCCDDESRGMVEAAPGARRSPPRRAARPPATTAGGDRRSCAIARRGLETRHLRARVPPRSKAAGRPCRRAPARRWGPSATSAQPSRRSRRGRRDVPGGAESARANRRRCGRRRGPADRLRRRPAFSRRCACRPSGRRPAPETRERLRRLPDPRRARAPADRRLRGRSAIAGSVAAGRRPRAARTRSAHGVDAAHRDEATGALPAGSSGTGSPEQMDRPAAPGSASVRRAADRAARTGCGAKPAAGAPAARRGPGRPADAGACRISRRRFRSARRRRPDRACLPVRPGRWA